MRTQEEPWSGQRDTFRGDRGDTPSASYNVADARFFTVAFCAPCGGTAPRQSPERDFAVCR
ncbi:hypothetical protein WME95_03780 [Sorangium sp. So ce327]|uniref:hypothetical protein n=1 Tax=Sorangium sp. So ce327 TaxID=3133301 RepID=UPI003F5F6734